MIHAFALEPQLVATWAKAAEFRFFEDKFGLGTPRVLLELPAFNKWRRAVIRAAQTNDLEGLDTTRLTELLGIFDAHRHRRADTAYDGLLSWLENAEREYDRRKFAAILATSNPRGHEAVLLPEHLTVRQPRWTPSTGASPARTPGALAVVLTAMLTHCRALHLVDPHFAPSEDRYRKVLTALVDVLDQSSLTLDVIRVHCGDKYGLIEFEHQAGRIAALIPVGITIEFVRWQKRDGGDRLHNRYVLTEIGGVALGTGLDAGDAGETDDVTLMTREQYTLRWRQYVDETGFDCVDRPAKIVGAKAKPTR